MEYLKTDSRLYNLKPLPKFEYPIIIGYMSTDGKRQYHSNLSQIKYINKISTGKVNLDLNHNMDNAAKRITETEGYDEKIILLLRFLLDKQQHLQFTCTNTAIKDACFICYRRTFISVMCSPFITNEKWRIKGTLFRGSIYLCNLQTLEDKQRHSSKTQREKDMCAWGYKFEQFLLSDAPYTEPNTDIPVIENEEFSLVFQTHIGHHNVVYGAQTDGACYNQYSEGHSVPKPSDYNSTLKYLKGLSYVELKTNRLIENYRQDRTFRKYKLLKSWCQCYLAGCKGLLVGFRDDNGIVHHLQYYETHELPNLCQDEWDPKIAITFLECFLTYVKNCFQQKLQTIFGQFVDIMNINPISLHFELCCDKKIRVTNNYDSKTETILPEWFIKDFRAK